MSALKSDKDSYLSEFSLAFRAHHDDDAPGLQFIWLDSYLS